MANQLPPKAMQDDYLAIQKGLENIAAVSQNLKTLENFIADKKKTIKELSEMEDDIVMYKMIGNILVKSDKVAVLEGLEDEITTGEMRIKTLNRQLDSLKKSQSEMAERFEEKYSNFMKNQS